MDEGLIIVLDYDKICRLCLQTRGALSNIFEEDENCETPLTTQIKLLTSIDVINNESFPQQICHRCRYEVEVGFNLRETAIKSHQLLMETNDMDVGKLLAVDNLTEELDDGEECNPHNFQMLQDTVGYVRTVEDDDKYIENRDVVNQDSYDDSNKTDCNGGNLQTEEDSKRLKNEFKEESEETEGDKSIRRRKTISDASPLLVCQLCLNQFHSMLEHSNHVMSHYTDHPDLIPYHVAQKPYVCGMCTGHQGFSFRSELVTHHRGHLNMNPYRCPEFGCNNVFKSKDTLRQHSYTHAEKKFICEVCGAAFRRRNELGQHCVRHQDEGIAYQCAQCKVVCKNRISFKAHIKHHVQGRRFKCPRNGCPKAFFSKSDLEVHDRSHTNDRRYKCTLCVCAYTSQSQLNRHLKQHERRKVTKCDKCILSFSDYTEFCNHRISTHGEWLPHRCKHCKQGYQNIRALERHVNKCKHREGVGQDTDNLIFNSKDDMDIDDMDMSVKSDSGLNLGDNSLQNNAESSFLYITDMDSQDGSVDKTGLDSQEGPHYMIIQEGEGDGEETPAEGGGHYMLIKDDVGDHKFTCKVLI